jgi:hypothetical protein
MQSRVILVGIIIVGLAGHAAACTCGGPWSVEEEFVDTELIVYGKVISKELISLQETLKPDKVSGVKERLKGDNQKLQFFESYHVFEIKFEIVEKYKGTVLRDTVTIYTVPKTASCGFKFEKGKIYIVYGSKKSDIGFMFLPRADIEGNLEKENTFWTSRCTRTTEYKRSEADELRKLKMKSG